MAKRRTREKIADITEQISKAEITGRIRDIEELWRFQREYRETRDVSLVLQAYQLARKLEFEIPPWVLYGLDSLATMILPPGTKPTKGEAFAGEVLTAFGFIPGDFEQAGYDDRVFAHHKDLKEMLNRAKGKNHSGEASGSHASTD